jgi:hypothetical protein
MPIKAMRSPRVFIPNKSFHDYSDAKRYGTLIYLTDGKQSPSKIHHQYREVSEVMKDAQAGDYLLLSGPASLNAIAASILAFKFGRINYLVFDAFTGSYNSRPILLDQDGGGNVNPRRPTGTVRA